MKNSQSRRRKEKREKQGTKNRCDKLKTNSKMVDLNPNRSIITLIVKDVN